MPLQGVRGAQNTEDALHVLRVPTPLIPVGGRDLTPLKTLIDNAIHMTTDIHFRPGILLLLGDVQVVLVALQADQGNRSTGGRGGGARRLQDMAALGIGATTTDVVLLTIGVILVTDLGAGPVKGQGPHTGPHTYHRIGLHTDPRMDLRMGHRT